MDSDGAVAVVGVAANVPGARDVEEYWLDLVRGQEWVTGSAAPAAGYFDAEFFGMTPREAQACDSRIRLFLETAHSAIENAGYDPARLRNAGVFASAGPPDGVEHHWTVVAGKLGLRDPHVTALAAGSSALVALHLAWRSLRAGDCDVAVVAGADLESACAVLVKRLADALADRDHIGALIRGIAADDGGTGDADLIMRALAPAGQRHPGPAAGMAGFVKMVLSLEREQLPPGINVTAPQWRPEVESTPLRLQDRLTAWPRDPCRPRRAAVRSMGVDGSSVHIILEEPPERERSLHAEEPRVVVWSGMTGDAERGARASLARFFTSRGEVMFADAVATLQQGRAAHRVRAAAVCTSAYDAASVLRASDPGRILVGRPVTTPRPVGLLFPGQGAQHLRLAHAAYRDVPSFAAAIDGWFDLLDSDDQPPLRERWLGTAGGPDLTDPVVARPLLFAVEAALARLWQEAGVRPAALLGQGIGALVAAMVAGMFTPAEAARLVHATARAMRDHQDRGLLGQVLAAVRPAPPSVPVLSAVTGRPITPEDAVDPSCCAGRPADPDPPLTTGYGAGEGVLVAAGPADADLTSLLTTAARLWTEGHDIAWERIGQAPLSRRVPMPGYAYQRRRFPIDGPARVLLPTDCPVDTTAGRA